MSSDRDPRLPALAEVLLRVGVNLQPGQPLLVSDPYDLLGVPAALDPLVAALRAAAPAHEVTVVPGSAATVRSLAEADDLRGYASLVRDHTRRLRRHLEHGGAFLFLTGGAPHLLAGLPAARLARFDAAKWESFGPLIQALIAGASQCCLAPAPTDDWAAAAGVSLPALWDRVFAALRIDASGTAAAGAWSARLDALDRRCAELNASRPTRLRYHGPGTDLTVALPRSHRWCTTRLRTRAGHPFVFNLPTEEVFTAPHRTSAEGQLRVARPVFHGGQLLEGVELEFLDGRVRSARAATGGDLLHELLATDEGARRLGEVSLIPPPHLLGRDDRPFHHILLDENAAPHVALGCAYRFCSRAWFPLALNASRIHLDLPLVAEVELA